jgi:hypothetical protein
MGELRALILAYWPELLLVPIFLIMLSSGAAAVIMRLQAWPDTKLADRLFVNSLIIALAYAAGLIAAGYYWLR